MEPPPTIDINYLCLDVLVYVLAQLPANSLIAVERVNRQFREAARVVMTRKVRNIRLVDSQHSDSELYHYSNEIIDSNDHNTVRLPINDEVLTNATRVMKALLTVLKKCRKMESVECVNTMISAEDMLRVVSENDKIRSVFLVLLRPLFIHQPSVINVQHLRRLAFNIPRHLSYEQTLLTYQLRLVFASASSLEKLFIVCQQQDLGIVSALHHLTAGAEVTIFNYNRRYERFPQLDGITVDKLTDANRLWISLDFFRLNWPTNIPFWRLVELHVDSLSRQALQLPVGSIFKFPSLKFLTLHDFTGDQIVTLSQHLYMLGQLEEVHLLSQLKLGSKRNKDGAALAQLVKKAPRLERVFVEKSHGCGCRVYLTVDQRLQFEWHNSALDRTGLDTLFDQLMTCKSPATQATGIRLAIKKICDRHKQELLAFFNVWQQKYSDDWTLSLFHVADRRSEWTSEQPVQLSAVEFLEFAERAKTK